MCDPISMAALAIGQGYMQYQQDSAVSKYTNRLADARNAQAQKAFEDQGRALNAKQRMEQDKIADEKQQKLIAYMENMGKAQASFAERGFSGRTMERDLVQRESDQLQSNTQISRTLDNLQTAFSFERNGLTSQLTNRLMSNNAQRKPKPSVGRAIITTGMNAGMAYASANSGTGADGKGQSFSQNWADFTT